MASNSRSTTLYSNNGYGFTLTASFNENSTDTANNTSNITCTATFSASNSNWQTGSPSTLTIYWHDNRENYDRYVASISFAGISTWETKTTSGTINVTHNNDGNLSGYAYAYFDKGGTTTGWACNSGGIATDWTALIKINRYPTLTSGTNFNDTQNPVYTISNQDTTHTVRVKIEAGGNTQLITRDLAKGYNGKYTLELTEAERNTLRALTPNSKTLTVRETVCAMSGNTELSASFKDYTMTVVDATPTLTATYEDTNNTTIAITDNNQLIIRNNSTLQIDVSNATAYKYATLSSIKVLLNGTTYSGTLSGGSATFNIGTINVANNVTATVQLTDSRGFIGTQNLNIQVLDWQVPSAIISLQRHNNFYSETDINVNAEYSSLDNKNTITIKVRQKKVSDTTYSSYTTLQDGVTQQFTLDNNYAWNIQVLITDKLGSTTYNQILDRGIPIVFFDRLKRSLGVNCFPNDDESLEVDGDNILTRILGYGQEANAVSGDWNTACGTASGIYMGNNLDNSPTGATVDGWWWVIHIVHNATYQRQIAFSFLNNAEMYTRIQNNGTWNSWTQVGSNRATTLFSNDNGTQGDINLSDDPSNYSTLEIIYNDGHIQHIDVNKSGRFTLTIFWNDSTNGAGTFGAFYEIGYDKLEYQYARRFYFYTHDNKPTIDTNNAIVIYKVLGYK